MSTKYFMNVTTIEELKQQYKKLAFKHHPDRGGDITIMQVINAEYEALTQKLKDETTTAQDLADFKEVIDKLVNTPGITIEIVGTWIWVSGETKPIKQTLSELHFHWNRKRELWQRKPLEDKFKRSRTSNKSDEAVKSYWGCKVVKGNFNPVLN